MATIASYTATLGLNIDQSSLGKVDKYLKAIENKLKSFSNRIGKSSNISVKLNVDTYNLKRSLDRALSKYRIRQSLAIFIILIENKETIRRQFKQLEHLLVQNRESIIER